MEEEGKEDEDAEGIVEREEEIQKKKDGFASSQNVKALSSKICFAKVPKFSSLASRDHQL